MKYRLILSLLTISAIVFFANISVHASPYGRGIYNANVPYGSQTTLSITTASGVNLSLNPSTSGTLGTANGTVTVTSTDVVGYKLYIRGMGSTNMVQGSSTIPASANVSAAALAVNTWGINTDASTNFVGISLSDLLLKNASGPFSSGDNTQVTFGLNLDRSKPAGAYSSNIMYTAVPQTP